MALDAASSTAMYSPVAEGYATPAQVQQIYEYAKLLDKRGGEDIKGTGWNAVPGGLAMMVNALHGNLQRDKATDLQQAALQARSQAQTPGMVPGQTPPSPLAGGGQTTASDDAPPTKTASEGGASVYALNGGGDYPMISSDAEKAEGDPETKVLALSAEQPPADGITAITRALQPGAEKPKAAHGPDWEAPIIPPQLVPRQPMYSREQVMSGLRNPTLSPEERKSLVDGYMKQFQPIQMPVTGGTVLINPANPYQQKFIPSLEKGTREYPGGYKVPEDRTYDPYGGAAHVLPRVMAPAPGAPGAGPVPPGGPQAMPFAPPGAAPPPGPAIAPAPPPVAPGAAPAPPSGGLPDASSGIMNFAPPENDGSLTPAQPGAMVPPGNVVAQNFDALKTPTPSAGVADSAKLAQAIPPGIPPEDANIMDYFRKREIDKNVEEKGRGEMATQTAQQFAKRYEDINQKGVQAAAELPQLRQAKALTDEPNFVSGWLADPVQGVQKVITALGGDPDTAAPNEVFRKLVAGANLEGLKQYLSGLGQVRVAEINLINQASASQHITPYANKAALEIALRTHERAVEVAEKARDYAEKNGGLGYGFDRQIAQLYKDKPLFNEAEIKNFRKTFLDDEKLQSLEKNKGGKGVDAENAEIKRILGLP